MKLYLKPIIEKINPALFSYFILFSTFFCCDSILLGQTRNPGGVLSQDGSKHRVDQVQHNNKDLNEYKNSEVYYYDFIVPQNSPFPYVMLTVHGGDGGKAWVNDLGGKTVRTGLGGQGATITSYFKIGNGTGELKPNSTLRMIVGQSGRSRANCWGCIGYHGGGGGGGTGILYLPVGADEINPNNWKILAVAGGGGGGVVNTSDLAINGRPGEIQEAGFINATLISKWVNNTTYAPLVNLFAHYGNGGLSDDDNASGGGGGSSFLNWSQVSNGTNWMLDPAYEPVIMGNGFATFSPYFGKGAFQQVNGVFSPIGGKGGLSKDYGGYGFGGGGGATDKAGSLSTPGGGGGGYSGGYSGAHIKGEETAAGGDGGGDYLGGGGGGSYLNLEFAQPASAMRHQYNTTGNPANGYVEYQLSNTVPVSKNRGIRADKGTEVEILKAGEWTLLWQYDCNLVLYQSGVARWASNTQNKGATLIFQGDGNMVIYNNGNPVWTTGTEDNHYNGKGGRKLILTPQGSLCILDQDDKVIWQGH